MFSIKNKGVNMKLFIQNNQNSTKNKKHKPWRNNGQFNNHRFKEKLD